MWVRGRTWDDGVYTGIRQLHEAKGFDPWSQAVAIELGYPLFQVSCEMNGLLAHLQESDAGDDYSDSNGDDNFSDSEDQESGAEPDALQDTALAGDTDINPYQEEEFLSNLYQTDERYDVAVTSSSTISFGRAPTGCDPPLASLQLTDDRQKQPHPPAFQSGDQRTSSKRARVLSPGSLLHEAPNFSRDSLASFASSSRVTLDDLRSSNTALRPASPLGDFDHLVDPLRDRDAAEVDAVMILSQLGART
ncbi:hypothetical protein B0H19DRAFT_1272830 [Mycena capillaripes]|nr:hypothetical protein B0H19DRAFT_1272830 [Mycena capillaripes]